MSTKANRPKPDRMLKSSEVARLFGVNSRTVGGWAKAGKLTAIRTAGSQTRGHYRFREPEVMALLNGHGPCQACEHQARHDPYGCTAPDCDCTRPPDTDGAGDA